MHSVLLASTLCVEFFIGVAFVVSYRQRCSFGFKDLGKQWIRVGMVEVERE